MDKKYKQLTVRINEKRKDSKIHLRNKEDAQEEVAAALDNNKDSNENKKTSHAPYEDDPPSIKVLERPYLRKKSILSNIPKFKHLFIAGFAAIFVGLGLGLIMLKLFSGVGAEEAEHVNTALDTEDTITEDEEAPGTSDEATSETINYSFEGITPNVIQIGVFTAVENANEFVSTSSLQNIKPIIWERDGQFYVFVGLAQSKEVADELESAIEEIIAQDVIDKEWPILAATKDIPQDEGEWIHEGMNLWSELVASIQNKETVSGETSESLNEWYIGKPTKVSEGLSDLDKEFNTLIQMVSSSTEFNWDIHHQALSVLQSYENYIMN